jgi:mono/diheme cytochrome c family protein
MIQAGEYITMVYCSNCHSPSETGIRPLHRYFPEGTDRARMEKFVKGALTSGNIAYMPKMPMLDSEIEAISAYLVMNNNGGQPAIDAAIQKEVKNRNSALAEKKAIDKVAAITIEQEVK